MFALVTLSSREQARDRSHDRGRGTDRTTGRMTTGEHKNNTNAARQTARQAARQTHDRFRQPHDSRTTDSAKVKILRKFDAHIPSRRVPRIVPSTHAEN